MYPPPSFSCGATAILDAGRLIVDISRSHTDTFLWTRDRPVAETSTWQHTTRHRNPCSRRDSNPQSQQQTDRLRPRGHRGRKNILFSWNYYGRIWSNERKWCSSMYNDWMVPCDSHGTIRTVHTTYAAALNTTTHPKTRCRKPYAATQHLMLLMLDVCTRNMSS